MEAGRQSDVIVNGNLIVLKGNANSPILGSIKKNSVATIPAGTTGYNAFNDILPPSRGQLEIAIDTLFVITLIPNVTAITIATATYENKLPNISLK
jgi:hypothetical protein